MKDRKTNTDIAEQDYKGPSRIVSAGGRGLLEARVMGVASLLIGGTLGVAFKDTIHSGIAKIPGALNVVRKTGDAIGAKHFGPLFGNERTFRGFVMGSAAAYLILPWMAFIHGSKEGLDNANAGHEQFEDAKREIKQLRGELAEERAAHKVTHAQYEGHVEDAPQKVIS